MQNMGTHERLNPAVLRRKLNTAWTRYNPLAIGARANMLRLEAGAFLHDLTARRSYNFIPLEQFTQGRKISDTIFVFGSGSSLKDVTPEEWAKINLHNTLGWKSFVYQEYVHADFLILREVMTHDMHNPQGLRRELTRLMTQAMNNSRFENALMLVQEGWRARAGNELFGSHIAPQDRFQYARFKNGARYPDAMPSESFSQGITHIHGTLTDAVNLAFLGGWKHIVLIGIDLYDSAYFVAIEQKEHLIATGGSAGHIHPTAKSGIVEKMAVWRQWLYERGVTIHVYNPRSLMAEIMPVFDRDTL